MSQLQHPLKEGDTFVFSEKIWMDEWAHYRVEVLAINPQLLLKFVVFDGDRTSTVDIETEKITFFNDKYVEIELNNLIKNKLTWRFYFANKL